MSVNIALRYNLWKIHRVVCAHLCSGSVMKSEIALTGEFLKRSLCTGSVPVEHIRNFCIVAHVDHGKSTLADRLLEMTGAIEKKQENKQVLDRLPVEKERGITVKAVAATLDYTFNGITYQLNLIDTPGHVDFSNEVSRSLAACQGVILLVDAKEGVQAQTIANFYQAFARNLTIIPVLNKIDLRHADPEKVEGELLSVLDIEPKTVMRISAKTGFGVEQLLQSIIQLVPFPKVAREKPFKALIIDSWYDNFRGNVLFVYVIDGSAETGMEILSHATGKQYQIRTTGKLRPEEVNVDVLLAGEVGLISCNMRGLEESIVGDTIFAKGCHVEDVEPVVAPKPVVFAGLFPRNQDERDQLRSAMEKLLLNDPSVSVSVESSLLGLGWRLGFLGLLHLDVFRQRLELEFNKEVVLTVPSVTYRVVVRGKNKAKEGENCIDIKNPSKFPDPANIVEMYEPVVLATIIAPMDCYEKVYEECKVRRGVEKDSKIIGGNRMMFRFVLPLSEIIFDFHDKMKRITSGFASYEYEDAGYASAKLEKLTVTLNGKLVEELVQIVHSSRATAIARRLALKMKELVPRQQVAIAIQVYSRGKVIAREDIKPYRKDVTAKLYGGDITRRMKLLKNQREGKKKMRQFANIQIPRDTFIDVLRGF